MDFAVEDLLAEHLAPYRRRTRQNHADALRRLQSWLGEVAPEVTLVTMRRHHVEAWMSHLGDSGLRAITVRSLMGPVRAWTRWLLQEGRASEDVCRFVRLPRAPRRDDKLWLDAEQCRRLLQAAECEDPGMQACIFLWALSGLRPREPLTLDVTDLGEHAGHGVIMLHARKGGDGDRLGISDPTWLALQEAAGGRTAGPLIMHPRLDRPMDLPSARARLHHIATQAGLPPDLTPYALRASFITIALEEGVSERAVAESAGQASTSQIPVYDRRRRTVSLEHNATTAVTRAVLSDSSAA